MTKATSRLSVIIYSTLLVVACYPTAPTKEIPNTPTDLTLSATAQLLTHTQTTEIETTLSVWIKNENHYEEVGLLWVECQIYQSESGVNYWELAQKCLGVEPSQEMIDQKNRFGEFFFASPTLEYPQDLRLAIGNDVYETKHQGPEYFELMKNGETIVIASGSIGFDPMNKALLDVNGKITWEFLSNPPTIIYDGIDLREKYSLDAAYIPNSVNENLIFVAEKDGKYFVMYGEQKLGPSFDYIKIAYCCEGVRYSISRPINQYWFWGTRDGKGYVVAITEN